MSDIKKLQIKICEQCFLCHSVVFCPTCSKCPQCCTKSACRGQTSKLLGNLAGSRGRSEGSSNPEKGLSPPLPVPAPTHKVSFSHKPLCQSPQEQLPAGGITSAYRQKRSGTGSKPDISRVFQPTISSPKTQQQVEAHTRSEQAESLSQNREIQNGDTRNHQNISPTRGVGHLNRFQGRLLPHPNTGTVQEIPQISYPGSDIPIQGSSFWSVHSAHGVHCSSKGGETGGHTSGYKNLPVPRRLVGEGKVPPYLSPAYPNSGKIMPRPRMGGEHRTIRAGTKTGLRLCRLPVRPQVRPTPDQWQTLQEKIHTLLLLPACPVRQFMSLIGRLTATERQVHLGRLHMRLENTGTLREGHSNTKVSAPSFTMVAKRRQCSPGSTITPNKACSANLYRRIKRRVGRSSRRAHCKRGMVTTGKQTAYKLSGTESCISGSKRVPGPLLGQDSPGSNGQHDRSGLYKQGWRHEVGSALCPIVENLDLVYQETSDSQGLTHSRPAKCSSRQIIQAGSDHPGGVVSRSRSFPKLMQQVAPASNRPFCHEVQQ